MLLILVLFFSSSSHRLVCSLKLQGPEMAEMMSSIVPSKIYKHEHEKLFTMMNVLSDRKIAPRKGERKRESEKCNFWSREDFMQLHTEICFTCSRQGNIFWQWKRWEIKTNRLLPFCCEWQSVSFEEHLIIVGARFSLLFCVDDIFFKFRVLIVVYFYGSWHCACGNFRRDCNFLCRLSRIFSILLITSIISACVFLRRKWSRKLGNVVWSEEIRSKLGLRNGAVASQIFKAATLSWNVCSKR